MHNYHCLVIEEDALSHQWYLQVLHAAGIPCTSCFSWAQGFTTAVQYGTRLRLIVLGGNMSQDEERLEEIRPQALDFVDELRENGQRCRILIIVEERKQAEYIRKMTTLDVCERHEALDALAGLIDHLPFD